MEDHALVVQLGLFDSELEVVIGDDFQDYSIAVLVEELGHGVADAIFLAVETALPKLA